MSYDAYRIENSDIRFYRRPAIGYQVILMARTEALPPSRRGLYRQIIVEYRYGSSYSYPAPDEATSREHTVSWAIGAIADYWRLKQQRIDARIYPFGGLVRDMRLVTRKLDPAKPADVSVNAPTTIQGLVEKP